MPGTTGAFYPYARFDARFDSIAVKGKYAEALFTLKNMTSVRQPVIWSTLMPRLLDADGGEVRRIGEVFKATRDEPLQAADLEPDAEIQVRYRFELPPRTKLQTLSVTEGKSRSYIFDVSNTK